MQNQFSSLVALIQLSRTNAIRAVNAELINLYWNIGAFISKQLADATWGESTVDELAFYIKKNQPTLKGFDRRGLYRMKQFYEVYVDSLNTLNDKSAIVTSLMSQLQPADNQE
jgi:hypothetical protein